MPTLTQEDIEYLKRQGLDPDSFQFANTEQPKEQMSSGRAIMAQLKGKAGGIGGGGLGVLGGTSIATFLAPWLLGPEAGIPADLLLAGAGALGGTAGGLAGQKTQQLLQSDETNRQQQQDIQTAEQQHPYLSMATDIGASALASGGSPSLRAPLAALSGSKDAIRKLLIQSAANPAINSAVNYGLTGQAPTVSDLGAQALGGALFAGNRNPLARLGTLGSGPRAQEVSVPDEVVPDPTDKQNIPVVKPPIGGTLPDVTSSPTGIPTSLAGSNAPLTGRKSPIDYLQSQLDTHPQELATMENEGGPVAKEADEAIQPTAKPVVTEPTAEVGNTTQKTTEEPAQEVTKQPTETTEQIAPVKEDGSEGKEPTTDTPIGTLAKPEPLTDEEQRKLKNMDLNPESGSVMPESIGASKLKTWALGKTPSASAQPEADHIVLGNVDDGRVIAKEGLKSDIHGHNMGDLRQRFRYLPENNKVIWMDDPTKESQHTVDNFINKKSGMDPIHTNWRDEVGKSFWFDETGSTMPESEGARKLKDWADYQEAGKRMESSEPNSDEYMKAWNDREAVKNRNQGKTPVDPSLKTTGESGFIQLPKWVKRVPRLTISAVDNVLQNKDERFQETGKGYIRALNEQGQLRGQFVNPTVEAGKPLSKADMDQINVVKNAELTEKRLRPDLLQNDAQKNYYNTVKKNYSDSGDYAINKKIPITVRQGYMRLMKKNPWYWAGMPNQKIEQIYRNSEDHDSIDKLDNVFEKWNMNELGMTQKESDKYIDNFKKTIAGNLSGSGESHQDWFNPLRKMQGEPLPPEFREQNPVKNDARYFSRFAVAASHYNNIESQPKIMAALGQTKDAWGNDIPQIYPKKGIANNPDVQTLIRQFHNSPETSFERAEGSFSGVTTAALISAPPLEVHKVVSNEVKALSFARNPYQATAMLVHGLKHIKEGYQHAKEEGVVKLTASSSKDMLDGSLTSAERMVGLAKGIRQVSTLNDLTTKFNAGLLQSQFEYLVPSKIQSANAGNVTDQKFIQRLDPDYQVGKTYTKDKIQELAGLAAQYVHGTGDARQMPGWMLHDSEVSGFFNLAHWSVAQTTNFIHDILEPAQRGDYVPMITSVFGALAGGYIIKELRQDISGKKNPIPSLSEIAAGEGGLAAHKSLLAYNAIAAMQYSGFGGLLSQVIKYPFDFAYKNQPQGATFPLDELATDFAGTLKDVSSAIANDPDVNWIDLAKAVTGHTLSNNIQLARIAINNSINAGLITGLPAEKKALSDSMAQLRRFDEVEGLPYNDIDEGSNPYMNIEQKKFKYNENPQEAVQQIPSMVSAIMTKYAGKPDVIMAKLKGLKENQFSTFPSMESMPLEFMKYVGYLQREEGPEQAQAELQNYMKHKMINQVKSSVVP